MDPLKASSSGNPLPRSNNKSIAITIEVRLCLEHFQDHNLHTQDCEGQGPHDQSRMRHSTRAHLPRQPSQRSQCSNASSPGAPSRRARTMTARRDGRERSSRVSHGPQLDATRESSSRRGEITGRFGHGSAMQMGAHGAIIRDGATEARSSAYCKPAGDVNRTFACQYQLFNCQGPTSAARQRAHEHLEAAANKGKRQCWWKARRSTASLKREVPEAVYQAISTWH